MIFRDEEAVTVQGRAASAAGTGRATVAAGLRPSSGITCAAGTEA